MVRADGTDLRQLTTNLPAGHLPGFAAWSPDGQTIAFSATHDGEDVVYRMHADGSDQVARDHDHAFGVTDPFFEFRIPGRTPRHRHGEAGGVPHDGTPRAVREGNAGDYLGVSFQHSQTFSGRHIPDLN